MEPRDAQRSGRQNAARTSGRALPALLATGLVVAALAAPGVGCGPRDAWPAGALISAQRADLVALLARLERLEGTPLARRAAALREALPACPVLVGRDPEGSLGAAAADLRCATPEQRIVSLERQRAGRALAFALPLANGGRARGTLALAPGGDATLELALPRRAARGAARLLLPADAAPGPPTLAAGDLVHARWRVGGSLDLASWVPAGSQGDRLFHLRSRIFGAAVLDGRLELAVYLPAAPGDMPRAALALGVRQHELAHAGVEELLRDVQARWPVHASRLRIGGADARCLLDLNLLPALAPCVALRGPQLIAAWNPQSLERALRAAAPAESHASPVPGDEPPALLRIALARLPEADRLLAGGAAPDGPPTPPLPWRRLEARRLPDAPRGELRLRLELGA